MSICHNVPNSCGCNSQLKSTVSRTVALKALWEVLPWKVEDEKGNKPLGCQTVKIVHTSDTFILTVQCWSLYIMDVTINASNAKVIKIISFALRHLTICRHWLHKFANCNWDIQWLYCIKCTVAMATTVTDNMPAIVHFSADDGMSLICAQALSCEISVRYWSSALVTMAAASAWSRSWSVSLNWSVCCNTMLYVLTCRCRGRRLIELIMALCHTAALDLLQRTCMHLVPSMDGHIIDSSAGPAPNAVGHT